MIELIVAGVALWGLSGRGPVGAQGAAVASEPGAGRPVPSLDQLLSAIRLVEGTSGADGYHTLYGGQLWEDLSDHPYKLGWEGVPLSDAQCARAGRSPGCRSWAAGAYQFNKATWDDAAAGAGLVDFSPESQDQAAAWLLAKVGALGVPAADAVRAMATRWDGFNAPRWAAGAGLDRVMGVLA